MKKMSLITVLLLVLLLTSCIKNEIIIDDIDDPLECSDIEILVDDECIALTGPEIQLRTALANTSELSNYKLLVNLSSPDEEVVIEINVTDNISQMRINTDKIISFKDNGVLCDVVETFKDTVERYTVDCEESNKYSFFREFIGEWFTLVSGKYVLDEDYYDDVENLLGGTLSNATIKDVKISVQYGFLSEVILIVEMNEVDYTIEMMISDYNNIVILWEEGEE